MIGQDKLQKIIVIILVLFLGVGLFLTTRFLKDEISRATKPSAQVLETTSSTLDMDALNKVLHRFKK